MLGWLADDMKEPPDQLAARISFLLEDELPRVVRRFSSHPPLGAQTAP